MVPEAPAPDSCLFLDVDGTLIDIAATPDAVVVPPALLDALRRAEDRLGGALALVSGRSVADLDRLFSPRHLRASGVHGAEIRFEPGPGGVESRAEPVPDEARAALASLLDGFPACFMEDKGFSIAVHYRAAPDAAGPLRGALDRLLRGREGRGLALMPGHSVFELKRPGVDKGGAVAAFMGRAPFAGRRPVFVGDDVTDEPGFAAARAHGGRAYSVTRDVAGTDATFPDPAAVRRWLAAAGDASPQRIARSARTGPGGITMPE